MNVLSLNAQGLGEASKRKWVCKLCTVHHVIFLSIQEIKFTNIDLWGVRQLWGNMFFDFASSLARGRSGGILFIWNKTVFVSSRVRSYDNYLVVEGV